MASKWEHPEIFDAVERALAEDIGSGDITTTANGAYSVVGDASRMESQHGSP